MILCENTMRTEAKICFVFERQERGSLHLHSMISQTSLSKDTRIIDLKIQTNNSAHKNPKQKRKIQVKKLDEFICTLCDKKFEYKSTLRNHNILKHGYIVC